MKRTPAPPIAERRPHVVHSPHGDRSDDYFWLRDDHHEDADVLTWLRAENEYTRATLAPLSDLTETILSELNARIVRDDASVPYHYRGYWYYRRVEGDGEYPIHARKRGTLEAAEEILLDGNALAQDHAYFEIGDLEVSPDGRWLAWAEDTVGRGQYTLRFRDLTGARPVTEFVAGCDSDLVWADDNRTVFYIENDPETLLGMRVRRHRLFEPVSADEVVYELDDDSFQLGLGRTGDDRFIVLTLGSTVTDEWHVRPANAPDDPWTLLIGRERGHEFDADHIGNEWIIRSNWQAENFRVLAAPDSDVADRSRWRELVAHDPDVYVAEFDVFNDYMVLAERRDGLRTLRVLDRDGQSLFSLDSDDPAHVMDIGTNPEQSSAVLRYTYESLTTPETVYAIDMGTRERRLLKREPVGGNFDARRYRSERLWSLAGDGARIPVSVVYRQDTPLDGTAPLLQYAYGAYGISTDPEFDDNILSLLDRGFVYAIAHVRGGQELGRHWYDEGKLAHKRNSFNDFIDVTLDLVARGYAAADRIAATGGSAGGLLCAAVANLRPELYAAMVVDVPFVDVVTTMLDDSIPLTTLEYDEWGDPRTGEGYRSMLAWSPYDNVRPQRYPALLVTAGLHDGQVQYHEPAKWVARLRATGTGDRPVLLHTNMDAGHGGESGRFRGNRELAMEFAFLVDQLG